MKGNKVIKEPDYLSDFRNCGSQQYQGEWLLQCDTSGLEKWSVDRLVLDIQLLRFMCLKDNDKRQNLHVWTNHFVITMNISLSFIYFRPCLMWHPWEIFFYKKTTTRRSRGPRGTRCFLLSRDLGNFWGSSGIQEILRLMSAPTRCYKLLSCAVKRNFKSRNKVYNAMYQ